MVISIEDLESFLVDAVESRHDHQFRYILETLQVNPDESQKCFNGLSLFEKILTTPRSKTFIDLCIQSGSDFYKKNNKNVYPVNYALQSLCADNLRAILKFPDRDDVVDIRYSMIINEKSEGGNNYLHYLIDRLNEENFTEVSELIQIIVRNGCSTNSPNNRLESPFYLLLRKLRKVSCDNSLIEFVLDNSDVDLFSYRSDEVTDMMNERGLSHRCAVKDEAIRDCHFMIRILEDWNEQKFIDEFENYRLYAQQTSLEYTNDISRLLEAATVRNLVQAVHLLLMNGARVNGMSKESNSMPAFLACTFGNPEVLKRLLDESSLSMQCLVNNRSLLHQICMSSNIHEIERKKCFDLIISDVRCSLTVINSLDDVGQTPLFWACHFGFDEIAKELLRRGAYIGHDSIINNISKEVLGEFLDECIKSSSDIKDTNCEIHIDFRFLLPPNAIVGTGHQEVLSIRKFTKNDRLKELILHPVISTFLYLKWRKVNWIIYLNLLLYFSFMIFLGTFIIFFFRQVLVDSHCFEDLQYSSSINRTQYHPNSQFLPLIKRNMWYYRICVFIIVSMSFYEIVQCLYSFPKYFFKLSNWLDMALIGLSFAVVFLDLKFCDHFKKIFASLILVMAAQTIQLVAKMPALSMSLHMAIFKRVCLMFLKTVSLYLVLIVAFAISFHILSEDFINPKEKTVTLSEEAGNEAFSNLFLSIITTVRMMLSDFDSFQLKHGDIFEGVLFLLFVTLISIVLFNLINALAISNTAKILKQAEFFETRKRISTLNFYEKVFVSFKKDFANILPRMASIILTPNRDNDIRVKQAFATPLDVKIDMLVSGKPESFFKTKTFKYKFWKKSRGEVPLEGKVLSKIVNFVKARQAQANEYNHLQNLVMQFRKAMDPDQGFAHRASEGSDWVFKDDSKARSWFLFR